jgi:hypothetical protein
MEKAHGRRVHFGRRQAKVRQPYDDEYSVMREISRHLSSCRSCVISAQGEREIRLCRTGYLLAKDVFAYLRLDRGRVTSVIASRAADDVEIEVPTRYSIVWRLLSQRRGTYERQSTQLSEEQLQHGSTTGTKRQNAQKHVYDADLIRLNVMVPSFNIPVFVYRSDLRRLNTCKVIV